MCSPCRSDRAAPRRRQPCLALATPGVARQSSPPRSATTSWRSDFRSSGSSWADRDTAGSLSVQFPVWRLPRGAVLRTRGKVCTYQPVPMTFPERAINPLAPVSSRSPVPGSTFMVTEFNALIFLGATDDGWSRLTASVVRQSRRPGREPRVAQPDRGPHFKVSNPERSALKSHGSPLASPNVSPLRSLHGQVQGALPEKVRVA